MTKGRTVQQEIVQSAARTADGVSNGFKVEHTDELTLAFLVTAAGGTTQGLGFAIQWSVDNSNWFTSDEIVRTIATGLMIKTVPVLARYMRVTWDVTGTSPSFTFKVDLAWRE